MKKNLLTLSLIVVASLTGFSQILNGGFENWSAAGNNCDDPDNWGTLNGSTDILGICTAQQETASVNSGSSALYLNTQFIGFPINQTAPGIVTNGTINTNTQAVEGGHDFTDQPAAFSFWYKANPVNNDEYSFSALLIDEVSGDTVGYAEAANTAIVNTYTEVIAPVTYVSGVPPTLLQVIFLPSDPDDPQVGSELWVDDLMSVGDITSVANADYDAISSFPNPVVESVFFNKGRTETAVVSIYNVLGTKVLEQTISNSNTGISMSHLPAGTYIWQFSNLEGALLKTGKLLLAK